MTFVKDVGSSLSLILYLHTSRYVFQPAIVGIHDVDGNVVLSTPCELIGVVGDYAKVVLFLMNLPFESLSL